MPEEKPAKAASKEKAPKSVKADSSAKAKEKSKGGDGRVETVLKAVEEMTVLELSELIKSLEEKFGVSAAAPVAVAAPGAAQAVAPGGAAAEPAEEKTEFDVMLQAAGEKKIQVIKVVRAVTNLGLKEAKDLVEGAPVAVKEGISKDEAEEVKGKLEEVGAVVELK